ncbi:hypothetical protein [Candidatus Spongiihabitans sp.]|uniref:hypothetical protein n=1 Tax=Candidatus Spongiihabitans sp. TaxID=3101308 RepID=UPI003C7B619D
MKSYQSEVFSVDDGWSGSVTRFPVVILALRAGFAEPRNHFHYPDDNPGSVSF